MNPTLYTPQGKPIKRAIGFDRRYVSEDQSTVRDLISCTPMPESEEPVETCENEKVKN